MHDLSPVPHLSLVQVPVAPEGPYQLNHLQSKVKGRLKLISTQPSISTDLVLLSILLPSPNPLLLYGSLPSFLSNPSVCKKCGQPGKMLITKRGKNEGMERKGGKCYIYTWGAPFRFWTGNFSGTSKKWTLWERAFVHCREVSLSGRVTYSLVILLRTLHWLLLAF